MTLHLSEYYKEKDRTDGTSSLKSKRRRYGHKGLETKRPCKREEKYVEVEII